MKEVKRAERIPQFSPQAEALIRSRQHNPTYMKLRALLEQEEFMRGESLEKEVEQDDVRYPSESLIQYLARLFS
jgi:hypothetical protein